MPKVMAWQCPKTDQLFLSKVAYRRHLRQLARVNLDHRKIAKIRAAREEKAAAFRAGLSSIADIEAYVMKNERMLWDLARTWAGSTDYGTWKKLPVDWYPKIERLRFVLRYSDRVSNTHRCPINGVTNWGGRDPEAPKGYPGYSGSVEWWTILDRKNVDSHIAGDLFEDPLVCINTGTGGGGSLDNLGMVKYRYGVEIFLDDWPGLRKEVFLRKLAGTEQEGMV